MAQYVLFVVTGIGIIRGCFEGIERIKEQKREMKMDKKYIKELEVEIIRLKREMKICGVYLDKSNIEIFNKK